MKTRLKNFIQKHHNSSSRDYLARMNLKKPLKIKNAKKYSFKYWDGNRDEGYGGYKYIPGYWKEVAEKLIKTYSLSNRSKVLDIGCGKGFLLYEIHKLLPNAELHGLDVSSYALKKAKNKKKTKYHKIKAQNQLPFKRKYFDLIISLGTLHNLELFDLKKSIIEINRVSKKSYIMVESYRNINEMFNLQCWALTCESFFSKKEWIWLFKEFNYSGDYEFIYFS